MSAAFSEKTVPQLHEFLKTKGISVAGYKKNELVKIAEFIFNFKCPTDPDFTGDNTEKVIKERYKTAGCDVNPFKLTPFQYSKLYSL